MISEQEFLDQLLRAMRYTGPDTHGVACEAIQLRLSQLPVVNRATVFLGANYTPWTDLFKGLLK